MRGFVVFLQRVFIPSFLLYRRIGFVDFMGGGTSSTPPTSQNFSFSFLPLPRTQSCVHAKAREPKKTPQFKLIIFFCFWFPLKEKPGEGESQRINNSFKLSSRREKKEENYFSKFPPGPLPRIYPGKQPPTHTRGSQNSHTHQPNECKEPKRENTPASLTLIIEPFIIRKRPPT